MRRRYCFLLLLFLQAFTAVAQDTDAYAEQYKLVTAASAAQPLDSQLFGEEIGVYSGSLSFRQTDIALPGNDSLPVQLGRRLAVGQGGLRAGHFSDWDIDLPSISGVFAVGASSYGRNLGFAADAAGAAAFQRCSQFSEPPQGYPNKGLSVWMGSEYWAGTSLYVPGAGAQEIVQRAAANGLAPTDGRAYPLVTKAGWQIRCLSSLHPGNVAPWDYREGEGFLALSPDGTTYQFDWMARRSVLSLVKRRGGSIDRLFRAEFFIFPTKVTDRHGNSVTYTFNPAVPWQLLRIESSDGRVITLTYDASGKRVRSASDGQRTWTYNYTSDLPDASLAAVIRPDGSAWSFALQGLWGGVQYSIPPNCTSSGTVVEGPQTGTIVHPSGAVGTFTTQGVIHGRKITSACFCNNEQCRVERPRHFATRSVRSRQISGPGLPTSTWTHAYPPAQGSEGTCTTCADTKTVTITGPNGHVTRHTFGIAADINDGLLLRLDEGWDGSNALRTTSYRYRSASAGPYPSLVGYGIHPHTDLLVSSYHRPMDQKVIQQQGVSFAWGATAFDRWARPLTVTRSSSLGHARTDATAYFDHLGKWVIGQVAHVTNLDTGAVSESHTYDPVTAHRTASDAFGLRLNSFEYHPNGLLRVRYDRLGRPTTFNGYVRGIPQSVVYPDGSNERAGVNALGWVTSLTNEVGATTLIDHDAMGRVARVTHPGEPGAPYHPTTHVFERVQTAAFGLPAGHWRQTTTTGNARTQRYLDALWRVRLEVSDDITDPANTSRAVETRYDAAGQKRFVSTAQRSIASVDGALPGMAWTYDALGRVLLQTQDSERGVLRTGTEYLGGFQRRTTDARGFQTTHGFQAFDTPVEDALARIWLPEGATVTFDRDVFGKARSITRAGNSVYGYTSVTRSHVYDAHQRLCKTIEPETGATVQAYDAAGLVAWTASGLVLPGAGCDQASVPEARKIAHVYDARGQVVLTTHGDGSPSVARGYTPDGLLAWVQTGPSSWTYGYNNRRLLTSEVASVGGSTHALRWTVNAHGHVAGLQQQGDPYQDFAPDAFGRPRQISGYVSNVRYHPDGAVAGYTLANGIGFSQTQNLRGLPDQRRHAGVAWDQYAWDANGNVTGIADLQQGITNRSLTYDGLDRLVAASGLWGGAGYGYDAVDNLRASSVGSRVLSHSIDAANRLVGLSGSLNIALSHDANGNVVQRGGQAFRFDIGNRLVAAVGKATHAYDGHGRRAWTSYADGSWMYQAYDRAGRLRYSNHSSRGATRHVYLGDTLVAETNSISGHSFVHTDALGSPVARTNAAGQVTERARYEPYGAAVAGTTNPVGIGFTGHVNDVDTGLVYMQQRYYDPVAGRFLSVDPVATDAAKGSNFNRHKYAENNPYRFIDPDGRASCADKDCKTSTIDSEIRRVDGGITRVTFLNDDPKGTSSNMPISTKTAITLERVISNAKVSSININSTTGGDHSKTSAHFSGRAVDINRVDGKGVGNKNAGGERLQEVARSERSVRENFGPYIMEKRSGAEREPVAVNDPKLTAAHRTHIHISTQPSP